MTLLELKQTIIPEIGLSTENTVSSLKYAKVIQDALLCDRAGLYELFGEYSIIYQPKNILSGDFYFYAQKHGKVYLAVCDCSGHGISGAMLSVLGNTMLERSLKKYHKTHSVLTYLSVLIKDSFNHEQDLSNIGMDISLVSIDLENKEFEFSGAGQSLFFVGDNQVTRIRGNRKSIGCSAECIWTSDKVRFKTGDKFYLTSDGLPDQFGEKTGKKFSYTRLTDFIYENNDLSQIQFQEKLLKELQDHKGQEVQTDDILFLGITL